MIGFDDAVALYGSAVDSHAATVLVGAGLSQGAGYPGWGALLGPFFAEFETGADDAVELPLLAQYVAAAHGRERLVRHVVEVVDRIDATPTVDHHLVVQLPVDEVWTTNYDPMLETADPSMAVVGVDDDFVSGDLGRRRLNKMHGSIPRGATKPTGGVDEIVITRDDYDEYSRRHPRAWQLLRAQFLTKSFLFLGFSMSDPNFDEVFKLVRLATPQKYMDHVALLRRGSTSPAWFAATCSDLERIGVHVLEIGDFAEITDFLRSVIARTRPIRLYVSGSYPTAAGDGHSLDVDGSYPTSATSDGELDTIATALGRALAIHRIRVAAGSELCARVGYASSDASGPDYDPDVAWVLRRYKDEPVTPPSLRKGVLRFIGTNPSEMRDAAFEHIRAIAVLGGGPGTRAEVGRARDLGMGVVPLAVSGGTAFAVWSEMTETLKSHTLGGVPIDPEVFAMLNDPAAGIGAAVTLIRQALYLDQATP